VAQNAQQVEAVHVRHPNVGQHQICRATKRRLQAFRRRIVHEVHLQDRNSVDRLGWKKVDADNEGVRHSPSNRLCPSAGRNSEIDDRVNSSEEPEPFVELQQLVCGSTAVILRLRPPHVRIVELPLQPSRR